jgi:hypothetical protein
MRKFVMVQKMLISATIALCGASIVATSAKTEYNQGPMRKGARCFTNSGGGWSREGFGYWDQCPASLPSPSTRPVPAPQAAAMGGESQWCRLFKEGERGGGDCVFYTFEQCAASTERLNGGGCYENPYYHGSSIPAVTRGVRAEVAHHHVPPHKPRPDSAYR